MPSEDRISALEAQHHIGRLDDFETDKISIVEVAGRTVGVVRKGLRVYAFANHCPHHGAPMCSGKIVGTMLPSEPDEYNFGMDGLVIRCPWHAYEFDLRTGESIGATMATRLFIYSVEVRDGDVFCQLKRAAKA